MQNLGWSSFHRARRFGSSRRGSKLRLAAASIAAAVILILLLLLLSALTDLLVTHGTLEISPGEQADVPAAAGKPDVAGTTLEYSNRGLLPLVWRLRGTALGSVANWYYNHWHALRIELAMPAGSDRRRLVFGAACMDLSRYGLERWAQTAARDGVRRLRQELFQQSTRLGAGDLLLGQRHNAVELFVERIETLAAGLVAWYRAMPHAVLVMVLLAIVALWVHPFLALAVIICWPLSAGSCSTDCGTRRTTARFIGAIGPRSNEPRWSRICTRFACWRISLQRPNGPVRRSMRG